MNGLPEISVEEGLDYLAVQRKGAIQIGLGVVAIMVGVGFWLVCVVFFLTVSV